MECNKINYNALFAIKFLNSSKLIFPSPSVSASAIIAVSSASVRGSPRLFIVSLEKVTEKNILIYSEVQKVTGKQYFKMFTEVQKVTKKMGT